jgi:hypothetical protein
MREKKRDEGGGLWLFIAGLALRRGARVTRGGRDRRPGRSRAGAGHWLEEEGDLDRRPLGVSGGEGYQFGIWRHWGVGSFWGWAKSVPCGFFLFCFISFPFSFSKFWFYS